MPVILRVDIHGYEGWSSHTGGGSDGQIGICTNGNDSNTLNNSITNLL